MQRKIRNPALTTSIRGLEEASRWPADLIVIGPHGCRGVGRLVLGSSAEHILRYAPVPMLLVCAPEAAVTPKSNLAPTDANLWGQTPRCSQCADRDAHDAHSSGAIP